jgi:hypothetical protein
MVCFRYIIVNTLHRGDNKDDDDDDKLKEIMAIITIKQPTSPIKNGLSNVDCRSENQQGNINVSHTICVRECTL